MYSSASICWRAVVIGALGSVGPELGLLMLTVFAAGFCVVGAQSGSNALAASLYPTSVRATGVGWALGSRPDRLDHRTRRGRHHAGAALGQVQAFYFGCCASVVRNGSRRNNVDDAAICNAA